MLRSQKLWIAFVVFAGVLAGSFPSRLSAQDDDDAPLGDVARNLRKKSAASQDVIDNDNLSQVMTEGQSHRLSRTSFLYSILGGGKSFQVAAPDVTCSLSFSANAKSLLSTQYVQMEIPAEELSKLEGPATIQQGTLAISLFNGTDWHLSELAVALTLVKKADAPSMAAYFAPAKLSLPAADGASDQDVENPSAKRSDVTILYKMRAAGAPAATTIFTAPLNIAMAADQEWHWAIVEAKGYSPRSVPPPTAAGIPQIPAPVAGATQPASLSGPLWPQPEPSPLTLPPAQSSPTQ